MKIVAIAIVACIALGLFFLPDLLGTAKTPDEAQLEKAVEFVRQCTDTYYLREDSSFLMIDSEKNPSDWLEYFFSPYASAGWAFEGDESEQYAFGGPVKPRDVVLLPDVPNIEQTARFQMNAETPLRLYIDADDTSRTINVRGVIAGSDQVVVSDSWPFPQF